MYWSKIWLSIFLNSLSFFRSFFEAPLKVEPKEAWVYCQFMTASTMGERLLTSLPSLDENLKLFLAFFTFFYSLQLTSLALPNIFSFNTFLHTFGLRHRIKNFFLSEMRRLACLGELTQLLSKSRIMWSIHQVELLTQLFLSLPFGNNTDLPEGQNQWPLIRQNIVFFCSSQQLPCLGPLKGLLS